MKFNIDTKLLKKYISKLSYIPTTNNPNPASECILITVKKGGIRFEAISEFIDLRIDVKNNEKIEIEKSGVILVKARMFNTIIQSINNDRVELTKREKSILEIKSKNLEFELNLFKKENFISPDFEIANQTEDIKEFKIEGKKLKSLFNKIKYFCDETNARKILQGFNLVCDGKEIDAFATDLIRIGYSNTKLKNDKNEKFNVVIRYQTIDKLLKIIEDSDEVLFNFGRKKAIIKQNDTIMIFRLLQGKFPEIKGTIFKNVKDEKFVLEIKKSELNQLINMTTIFNNSKMNEDIYTKLIMKEEKLFLMTREQEIGSANISTENFKWKGEKLFNIAFNPTILKEALYSIKQENIEVLFYGTEKPFVVKGSGDSSFKGYILPFNNID